MSDQEDKDSRDLIPLAEDPNPESSQNISDRLQAQWDNLPEDKKAEFERSIQQAFKNNIQPFVELVQAIQDGFQPFLTGFAQIAQKAGEQFELLTGKLAEILVPVVEYYEANREILDRLDEWPEITGLSIDELEELSLQEAVELINERTGRGKPESPANTPHPLEVAVINSGAMQQAEATRTLYELYGTLPSSPATNLIKQTLNSPKRVSAHRRGQIKQTEHYLSGDSIITYKGNDSTLTLTLDRTKELFTKKIQSGAKVFNFLLEKLNEQNRPEVISFTPTELINKGIYANKDSTVRGLNHVLSKMYAISIEGVTTEYAGTKKADKTYAKSRLIAAYKVNYASCEVAITQLIRNNTRAITILPSWGYALNDNAYTLLDYLYYLARQNYKKITKDGYFNISLEAIRTHLGLPTIKEAGREPKKLIMDPIEKAITEIEEARNGADIKITPIYNYDYKNITEYLEGYLRIELDETGQSYMSERTIAQEQEYKKHLKELNKSRQKNSSKKDQ